MAEAIPLANQPATILGTSISIQCLAVFAVGFRLYARFKLAHGFGWDDLFISFACISTVAGTVFVDLQPAVGLGRHQATLNLHQIEAYLVYTYGSMVTYACSGTFVKVSILFQYLRISRPEYVAFKRVCTFMICLVSIWGTIYLFCTIFACIPIRGYWKILEPARCVMFGARNAEVKVQAYISQAASNMALDAIILLLPLYILRSFRLTRGEQIGLLGVFSLGGLVVIVSILRLSSILKHHIGLLGSVRDSTWYTPITIIWTCIEVDIAVLCASIPIFWPVITQMTHNKIFVVEEVVVDSEVRNSRHFIMDRDRSDDEQELTLSMGWQDAMSKSTITRGSYRLDNLKT